MEDELAPIKSLGYQGLFIDPKNPKNDYEKHFIAAGQDSTMEAFWAEQAKLVDWIKEPQTILDKSNPPFYKWFKGGLLNTCYNCVDRHAAKRPDAPALIFESSMTGASQKYTYKELLDLVSRFAGVLKNRGIEKGDRVIIYMPMIPEAIISILACTRIGAIHSIVFGGFGGAELANRIKDAKPKCIVTASCGIEPHKVVNYKQLCDEAIKLSEMKLFTILVQRDKLKVELNEGVDFDYWDEMKNAKPADCVPCDATDYLYILYTSGTTGTPKGIVREHGGNAVVLAYTMKHLFDIKEGEVYFSTSDIGWVVGHSYIIYGPLLAGATTLLYEGKPTTPDAGIIWKLSEQYNVRGLYSAPTALRTLRKEDPNGDFPKKYNISNLNMFSMAGERVDIPAYNWLVGVLDKKSVVNDNYWQTETGWSIGTNFGNLHTFPSKAGSCTKPAPGMRVTIIDDDGNIVKTPKDLGKVCIKLPMPPSFMSTLYGNDQAFIEKYLSDAKGYYFTGDAGYFDDDGYLHVTTRVDDIINTAGHRLSTSQMEEVLTGVSEIAEAAVVAGLDEIKGDLPVGLVVLKSGVTTSEADIEKAGVQKIRQVIGPVAAFRFCIVVDKLPKTRSGKILRNVLRNIVRGLNPNPPATIEDDTVIEKITEKVKTKGLGQKVNIQFEEDMQ